MEAVKMGYSHRTWACPFYRWDERCKVHCDGGCVAFPDRKAAAEYARRYCGAVDGWQACSIAQGLRQYYERVGKA